MYSNILFEISDTGVAGISLNRPEMMNCLDQKTCLELQDAFEICRQETSIKVIVLSGKGKAFCAGQDLKSITSENNFIPSNLIKQNYNPLITMMRDIRKPIICKLGGIAAGAGCSLVFASDIVIATEDAFLSEAFIGIGLVPDSGSSYFLPRLVGRFKAFELLTLGSKISANEALNLGLVNFVVPSDHLDKKTDELTSTYLSSPLQAIGLIKSLLNNSYHHSLEQMLEMEANTQNIAASTLDFKEGVQAFLEKRKPVYKGL